MKAEAFTGMRFCTSHWDRLRDAVEARGLKVLVSESGQEAARKMVGELQEGLTVDNFDPLMRALMGIVANAFEVAGPAIFGPNDDGTDRCPLCYLNEQNSPGPDGLCKCGCGRPPPPTWRPNQFDDWIEKAADDQVAAWKRFGEDA